MKNSLVILICSFFSILSFYLIVFSAKSLLLCAASIHLFSVFFFFFNFTAVLCSAHSYSFFSLGLTSLSWAPQSEHIALLFFHKQITSFLYKISDTIFSQLFTCFVTIAFFVSVVYLPLPSTVTFVFLFIVLPLFRFCDF